MQRRRFQPATLSLIATITAGIMATTFGMVGCNGGSNNGGKSNTGGGGDLAAEFEIAKSEEDPLERCEALVRVANKYIKAEYPLGVKNSLRLAEEAADDVSVKRSPADRASAFTQLAKAFQKARMPSECEDAIKEAQKAHRKIEESVPRTTILVKLALIKSNADDKKGALEDLEAAEAESEKIANGKERVERMGYIAYGHNKLAGNDASEDAKRIIGGALELANEQDQPGNQARMLTAVGHEQIRTLKDQEAGNATLDKALEVARPIENVNQQVNVLIDVAQVYIKTKQSAKASPLLREAEEKCHGHSECKPALKRIDQLRKDL